jgi:hypothetical protein
MVGIPLQIYSKITSSRSIFNLLTFAKDRSIMATIERKAPEQ